MCIRDSQRDTGLSVDVLSGAEEARLSYLGAVSPTGPNSGLLIDLGGGSTELVHYREGQILSSCSLPLGSLSLFSQYVAHLHPTGKERKAIRAHILSLIHISGWAGHKDPSLPPLQSQRPSGQTSLRPTSAQFLPSGRLKRGAGPGAAG